MAFDVSDHDQDEDHARLLVSVTAEDGSGSLVQIDAGSNAFAWRLAGIGFGSVLVALIYLLAATMFSRRRIAVLAGIFVAVDGMSYVMSRIGMNDIFVAVFIVAAYLVFWQVWSGRWPRSAWWALPLVGVLIGLAAATKWVGIYAMLGIWVLVFARSALGRFLLVALIAAIAVVMGFGAPWPFLVVALATLALALVVVWVRPIQLELRDLLGLSATMAVLAAVGLAFALAFNQVRRRPGAGQRGGARLQRAGPRRAGRLAGLSAAGRIRRAAGHPGRPLAGRPGQRPPLAAARRAGRLPVAVDRRLPGGDPAARLLPGLRAVPAAGPPHRRAIGRSGLWLVARRDPRPDVRLPLRPAGRPPVLVAVVELAAGPEAGLVLRARLRRAAHRRHLQRRQPDPVLGRRARPHLVRADGLEAAITGDGAAGGGLRLPVPALDPDRTRHLPLPLPDRGDLRHGGGGLRGGRDAALLDVSAPGDRLPGAGRRSWACWSSRSARPSPCPTGTSTWPGPSRPGTTPSSSRTRRRASAAS